MEVQAGDSAGDAPLALAAAHGESAAIEVNSLSSQLDVEVEAGDRACGAGGRAWEELPAVDVPLLM